MTIEPLDHRDPDVAELIHPILADGNAQEQALLGGEPAPPQFPTPASVTVGGQYFLGACDNDTLTGVICIGPDDEPGQLSIAALAVAPGHQRRGIAGELVADVLRRGGDAAFAVICGAANAPALALYQGFGFRVYRRGRLGDAGPEMIKLRRAGTLPKFETGAPAQE